MAAYPGVLVSEPQSACRETVFSGAITFAERAVRASLPSRGATLLGSRVTSRGHVSRSITYFWSRNLSRGSVTFFGLFASALA
jgi:hypothetical protein